MYQAILYCLCKIKKNKLWFLTSPGLAVKHITDVTDIC